MLAQNGVALLTRRRLCCFYCEKRAKVSRESGCEALKIPTSDGKTGAYRRAAAARLASTKVTSSKMAT